MLNVGNHLKWQSDLRKLSLAEMEFSLNKNIIALHCQKVEEYIWSLSLLLYHFSCVTNNASNFEEDTGVRFFLW
jgi:hypothetical protein